MQRRAAISAVFAGEPRITTARKAGVSRVTLYRWLKVYDPKRPVVSARPRKTGPKGPRWSDGEIDTVISIIEHNLELWSRRRLAAALADRGIVVSDKTAGVMLGVARDRLQEQRERNERAERARRSREVAAMIRSDKRAAERHATVRRHLEQILVPGVSRSEALIKIADGLYAGGRGVHECDITPDLEDLADAYLAYVKHCDGCPRWLYNAAIYVAEHGRQRDEGGTPHLMMDALGGLFYANKFMSPGGALNWEPAADGVRKRQAAALNHLVAEIRGRGSMLAATPEPGICLAPSIENLAADYESCAAPRQKGRPALGLRMQRE